MSVLTKLPPSPRGLPFLGNSHQLFFEGPRFLQRAAAAHGDVVAIRFGPHVDYLVNHPDLIKDLLVLQHRKVAQATSLTTARRIFGNGLLTNDGEDHALQRRRILPAFSRDRMLGYAPLITQICERRLASLPTGRAFRIDGALRDLALDLITNVLFGTEFGAQIHALGAAAHDAIAMVAWLSVPLYEHLEWLPLPHHLRFRRADRLLRRTVRELVAQRRKPGATPRDDLFTQLVLARDGDGDDTGMSEQQVRDEVMTFFMAGHATVASGLAWVIAELARRPALAAELADEVRAVAGDGPLEAEHYASLTLTRAVIAEALRLHPPAWNIAKHAREDLHLGGYAIPKHSVVMASPFVIQRDPRFYDVPEDFRPERFLGEGPKGRPRYAYLPFGAGPRSCVGEGLALLEITVATALIVRRFQIRSADAAPYAYRAMITLEPRHGVRVVLEARQ